MKNYMLNPNREHVDLIITGILKKNGHCPCRIKMDDTTMCPCDEFVQTGVCKCQLFVKRPASEAPNPQVQNNTDKK